jgi:hypothetical protein
VAVQKAPGRIAVHHEQHSATAFIDMVQPRTLNFHKAAAKGNSSAVNPKRCRAASG